MSTLPERGKAKGSARTILLLDGHSLAYRAFYALPVENFSTSSGQHTNAIYGFASMLINLLAQEKPDQVIVAFDVSRKTFRSERFPEYKANRAKSPEEFRSQLSFISEILEAFGIPVIEREGYEADDLIATLAKAAIDDDPNVHVLITTGDRDSFQLIRPGVTVLYPKKGVTDLARMDAQAVIDRYGISPEQYPDFAALRGDPSDNLPSIPGVGEKTAIKWIQEHGSLAQLVVDADQVPGKAGESLRSSLSQVLLNRELTHLVDDVPIEREERTRLLDRSWSGVDREKALRIFDDLEIKTLRERITKLPAKGSASDATSDQSAPVRAKNAKAMEDAIGLTISKLNEEDLLTKMRGEVAILLSPSGGLGDAVAISPKEGDVYWAEVRNVSSFLGRALGQCTVFGHALKGQLHGVDETIALDPSFDTELGRYLLNPGQREMDLATIVRDEFGYGEGEEVQQEVDLFSDSSFDPALASFLWPLRERLKSQLEESEQLELLTKIELPLTVILARMEDRGIGFDEKKARSLRDHFESEVRSNSELAFKAAGREFNVNSPKQLQVILFDELRLPKTKRIKSGYSTDADSLLWLLQETNHPFLTALLRIREVGKLSSIIDGLITASRAGRIHTTFQQTITATGRLSSIDPNLQNIPIRSEEGRRIRECFVAKDPYQVLLTADYSQIEMRIMAHLSKDADLIAAFASGEDLHNTVGARVFGVTPSQVTPEMR